MAAPWQCPSCCTTALPQDRYCGHCGEQRIALAEPVLRAALARWWHTLKLLIGHPGELTANHRDGRRRAQVPALTLFLAANLVFFVGQSLSGVSMLSQPLEVHLHQGYRSLAQRLVNQRAAQRTLDITRLADRFEPQQQTVSKATVLLMVPPMALACALLYGPRRLRWASRWPTAWTFGLHTYAFALLFLTPLFALIGLAVRLAAALGHSVDFATYDTAVSSFQGLVLGTYISLASRRVYGLTRVQRVACAVVLVALMLALMHLHRFVVFAAVLQLV